MGLVSRWLGNEPEKMTGSDFIDLSDYAAPEHDGDGAASTYVRFAEISKIEDLADFSRYVYDGNILILDFKKIAGEEIVLKRITNELRKLAQDVSGDIAGLGDSTIIVTPTGVKVDRRKLRAEQ